MGFRTSGEPADLNVRKKGMWPTAHNTTREECGQDAVSLATVTSRNRAKRDPKCYELGLGDVQVGDRRKPQPPTQHCSGRTGAEAAFCGNAKSPSKA